MTARDLLNAKKIPIENTKENCVPTTTAMIMHDRTISGQFSLFSMDAVDICAIDAERLRAATLPNAHTAIVGFF